MKDQLKQAVIDGNGDIVNALTQALLAGGSSAREILDEALLPGMEVVGARMREGDMFIPEVLLSARVMQGALDILKPHLGEGAAAGLGTVVIGTVEGDLHDIGKNLVNMMIGSAGFDMVDIGVDQAPDKFIEAIKNNKNVKLVACSALLTTTLPALKKTVDALRESGLQGFKIIVGGAPVTAQFAEEIGADAYAPDAGSAAEKAKEIVAA